MTAFLRLPQRTPPRSRRPWCRRALILVAVVALIVGSGEIGLSAHAERLIARQINEHLAMNGETTGDTTITLSSFPNLITLPQGRAGGLLVTVDDFPSAAKDIPLATVQVEYSNLRFQSEDIQRHLAPDFTFGEGTGRVYISGSTLALVSGIDDLQFAAADDASPAGVGEDKAVLTGTVRMPWGSDGCLYSVRVRSHVFFWPEGKRVEIDSEDLLSATTRNMTCSSTPLTDKQTKAILDAFDISLFVPSLPLGITPRLAFAQAGNLIVVGHTELSPLTGQVRARYPGGTSSQARWANLKNYFAFAPR